MGDVEQPVAGQPDGSRGIGYNPFLDVSADWICDFYINISSTFKSKHQDNFFAV